MVSALDQRANTPSRANPSQARRARGPSSSRFLSRMRGPCFMACLSWSSLSLAESPAEEGSTDDAALTDEETDEFDSPEGASEEEEAQPTDEAQPNGEAQAAERPEEPSPMPSRGHATDRAGLPLIALHFRSSEPGLRFFLGPSKAQPDEYGAPIGRWRLDTTELREQCPAPCARWVYPGEYTLGMAPPRVPSEEAARRAVRAREHLVVMEPSVVSGEYHSYQWLRIVGWATMGASLIAGSTLVWTAFNRCEGDGLCLQNTPMSWAGAATFFLGVSGGLLLTLKQDSVSFSVTPALGLPDPN